MGLSWSDRLGSVSRAEWESVLSRAFRPSPFLSPAFLLPWEKAFAADRPVRAVRWDRGGRAEGFLFLYAMSEGGGWELLGGEEVADSLDAVVAAGLEGAFWTEFLAEAPERLGRGPLRLPGLVEGSPALALLPGIGAAHGIAIDVEETDRAPFIPLPSSFEEYLALLGTKERHELRRKIRRAAAAIPDLSLRVTETREELARDFPSFVALHRLSHPEKRRFMDDRMERFFRDVAEGFLAAGRLRLAVLAGPAGDLAAAFQVETDGALLLYNSGFDPVKGGHVSSGMVLLARCVEDAIRRGRKEYDFLRGKERYKYDLGGRDRRVFRATLRWT